MFSDQHILRDLEKRKILVFTPSRRVAGRRVVCNDDYFIVKEAYESDGIIVSNDMYRDLQVEKPNWKRFIEERLLMYSFVNNKWVPPDIFLTKCEVELYFYRDWFCLVSGLCLLMILWAAMDQPWRTSWGSFQRTRKKSNAPTVSKLLQGTFKLAFSYFQDYLSYV